MKRSNMTLKKKYKNKKENYNMTEMTKKGRWGPEKRKLTLTLFL